MRAAFSDTLVALARQDPKVLLLTGDHGYALFDLFRAACPAQYINAGIAEQNMVGMAAGLARAGFHPYVYGLSAFVPVRVLEQIKLDVAHDGLPVVFCGDGAGFVYSHLGTSHQSTEDIACTRAIPGLSVMSPADRFELELCMHDAYRSAKPVYLRMGKADRGDVHSEMPATERGDLIQLKRGAPGALSILATGSMVTTALDITKLHFDEAAVWSVPFIKPMNVHQVTSICQHSSTVVTLEEHSEFGGMGSAVCEIAAEQAPVRICRIGVADRFSEKCGSYDYLLKEHFLDALSVKQRIKSYLVKIQLLR